VGKAGFDEDALIEIARIEYDNQGADPATPVAGQVAIYVKNDDPFRKLPSGAVLDLATTKVSAVDAGRDFLENKILAGAGIIITKNNPAGNENLTLSQKQIAASCYGASSPGWEADVGITDAIPFDTTAFQTQSGVHTPSNIDSGTATGTQTATTLQDTTKSWSVNGYTDHFLRIIGGTGQGQWRRILSNTADALTVASWATVPDNTSMYTIWTPQTSRLVAPIDGVYSVTIHAATEYASLALGVFIYINGNFHSLNYAHQAQNIELNSEHSRILQLNANDYVEMKVYVAGTGPTKTLFAGSARLWMQMHRV